MKNISVVQLSFLPGPSWVSVNVQGAFIQHYTVKLQYLTCFGTEISYCVKKSLCQNHQVGHCIFITHSGFIQHNMQWLSFHSTFLNRVKPATIPKQSKDHSLNINIPPETLRYLKWTHIPWSKDPFLTNTPF